MKRTSLGFAVLSLVLVSACSSSGDRPPPAESPDTGIVEIDTSLPDTAGETATSCADGIKNNDETDVDCGGKCPACDTNAKCATGSDCISKVCSAGSCAAAKCDDHVMNGTETDVDCGGTPCSPCADGKACTNETNCSSGVCTDNKCVPPSCTDGVLNHGESDIDCGGPSCGKCGVGKKCATAGDCTSTTCASESGVNRCGCPVGMKRIQLAAAGGGAYCIDTDEVNNTEYGVFLSTGPDPKDQDAWCLWNDNFTPTSAWPSEIKDKPVPVRYVDWCDAYAYCKKQSKRLCGKVGGGPTPPADSDKATGQWYNACSQGGSNVYPYPDDYKPKRCNGADYWTSADAGVPTALPRGDVSLANCFAGPMSDIFQMSGNVKEWEDSCDATTGSADNCLTRGGSFRSDSVELKCTGKQALRRDTRSDDVGFRCCL